jgi:hypothetical protein
VSLCATSKPLHGEAQDRLADGTPEGVVLMEQVFCAEHEKWLTEVEPGVFAHEDDMLVCQPAEHVDVVYVDEVA